jgi:hypothetical protein
MMKGLRLAGGLCLALLPCVGQAGGLAVSGRASTLGLGAELTARLTNTVNVRLGGNLFDYSRSFTQDDDDRFALDFELRSLSGILDWHPSGGGFRLSGGVIGNGNQAGLVAQAAAASYEIGNGRYAVSDVGSLTGTVTVGNVAGYAGIGFGNPVARQKRIGLVLDLGVAFQGSPEVTLRAAGPIAGDPAFQADLTREEAEFNDDARRFRYYPVISVGISVKLN